MAPQTIYVARRFGRLANRLVLTAHIAAYARERGHRVVNYTLHSYAHLFEHLQHDLACGFPVSRRRSWASYLPLVHSSIRKTRVCYHTVRYASKIAPTLPIVGHRSVSIDDSATDLMDARGVISLDQPALQARLAGKSRVFVYGWQFRAPELLAQHADEVRDYLRPADAIARVARQSVAPLREVADVVVGIHRRQGDYRTWLGGRYYFDDLAYQRWMHQIAGQFPGQKVAFLVCSDEPWDAASFAPHSVFAGPGSAFADITALGLCNLVVGPVSTFSQWASFAGNVPLVLLTGADLRVDVSASRVSMGDVLPGITPDELSTTGTQHAA